MALVGGSHGFLVLGGGEGGAPGEEVLAVVGFGLGVGIVEVDQGFEAGVEVVDDVGRVGARLWISSGSSSRLKSWGG